MLFELRPLFDALETVGDQFTPEEVDVVGRYLRSVSQALRAYAHNSWRNGVDATGDDAGLGNRNRHTLPLLLRSGSS